MSTDIPGEFQAIATTRRAGRIPLGYGILIAIAASVALWTLVFAAVRSLL